MFMIKKEQAKMLIFWPKIGMQCRTSDTALSQYTVFYTCWGGRNPTFTSEIRLREFFACPDQRLENPGIVRVKSLYMSQSRGEPDEQI
jgi:hypothetical protein